jgi:hypothetical protein
MTPHMPCGKKETTVDEKKTVEQAHAQTLPAYEPPEVVTYSDQEILEAMGPAQASTGDLDL